jgi:hypothetical protein
MPKPVCVACKRFFKPKKELDGVQPPQGVALVEDDPQMMLI